MCDLKNSIVQFSYSLLHRLLYGGFLFLLNIDADLGIYGSW